jgi:hypothetical protein
MTKVLQNITGRRFRLDGRGYIVDKLNPGTKIKARWNYNPKVSPHEETRYDDDLHLRDAVLRCRLAKLVGKLFKGSEGSTDPSLLWMLLWEIIVASQINRRDVLISMKHPFKGTLEQEKTEMSQFTSIALFVDDVERLLRDLYGDVDGADLTDLVWAIQSVVIEISKYVLPELRTELDDARRVDLGAGRGLPTGYGVSGSMVGAGTQAADTLVIRGRAVLCSPKRHSRYTVKFMTALRKYWPQLDGWRASATISKLRMCRHGDSPKPATHAAAEPSLHRGYSG